MIYDLGSAKLADFGLSKTLPVNKHAAFDLDDKFKLTGETGSYRFMAREVFVHEAYNNKVGIDFKTQRWFYLVSNFNTLLPSSVRLAEWHARQIICTVGIIRA